MDIRKDLRDRALKAIDVNYMDFSYDDVISIKEYINKMYDRTISKEDINGLYETICLNIESFSIGRKEVIMRILRLAFQDGIDTINTSHSKWALETLAWGLEKK